MSSVSLGYKFMTVVMLVTCALNVGAIIAAIVMFAYTYKFSKEGKSYEKVDAALDELSGTLKINIGSLGLQLTGETAPFIVATANTVYWRLNPDQSNKFSIANLNCGGDA